MTDALLQLTRTQILAHRRRVGALDERLPAGPDSLRKAAWVGLQDSGPRAALLQLHARVEGINPSSWEDPPLAQVWGPGFSAYVVAEVDAPLFTLARLPDDPKRRQFAVDTADRLDAFLAGRRMSYSEAGHALGVNPNMLRYGTTTGRLRIRWEGARRPLIWTVPAPGISPAQARLELARRYVHVLGPTTPAAFLRWAGIRAAQPKAAFDALAPELKAVRTPIGDGWILAADEESFTGPAAGAAPARLLPSGDPYFLMWGTDRELLVPDAKKRSELWTPRVWPGAVLLDGEVVGTWRRGNEVVTINAWRALSAHEREGVEAEAASLPIPGFVGQTVVRWLQ